MFYAENFQNTDIFSSESHNTLVGKAVPGRGLAFLNGFAIINIRLFLSEWWKWMNKLFQNQRYHELHILYVSNIWLKGCKSNWEIKVTHPRTHSSLIWPFSNFIHLIRYKVHYHIFKGLLNSFSGINPATGKFLIWQPWWLQIKNWQWICIY